MATRRVKLAVGGLVLLALGAAFAIGHMLGAPNGTLSGAGRTRMVRIPAGSFEMGSNEGEANEKPVHRVQLPSFEMDVTEVNVAQYQACVVAKACQPATTVQWDGISADGAKNLSRFCNAGREGRAQHPINCVNYEQASAYCRWAGKRLPTEQEWEYAARGTDGRTYPWGNEAPGPELLNACGAECADMAKSNGWTWPSMYAENDGFADTAPVGSFPRGQSPFGVLDMAGDAWEWTDTKYCSSYEVNATCSDARVLRGGNWSHSDPSVVRAATRTRLDPTVRSHFVGFRCVR